MTDEYVFEAENVTKRYRNSTVLDQVNFALQRGEIYGFVGENGAGKTTLMRIMAGLSYPTEGRISLFGCSGERQLRHQRSRIGCMIEAPALYGNMTAYQNLEIQRLQRGITERGCVVEALETVGLANTGSKTTRHFSLGMRQRLGIALALLGKPEFLILDEPVNGLDPLGVAEIRDLIRKLNKEHGVTLFVSSHILTELHQTATQYILLHRGRVLEELSQDSLDEKCRKCIAISTNNPKRAMQIISDFFATQNLGIDGDGAVLVYDHLDRAAEIPLALGNAGVGMTGMTQRGESLEDYFLRRIGGE